MRLLSLVTLLIASVLGEKSYYDVLGISKEATLKDIKSAYRGLAKQFHPDNNSSPEALEKFKEVAEAYEVLSDEEQKAKYDTYGKDGLRDDFVEGGSDFFSQFFGHHRPRKSKARPIFRKVIVTLEQVYAGTELAVTINRKVACLQAKSCIVERRDCAGPGVRLTTHRQGNMIYQQQSDDPTCISAGKGLKSNCTDKCPKGFTFDEERTFRLAIEPGMADDYEFDFPGEGHEALGSDTGDVTFILAVDNHPIFTRVGYSLKTKLQITLREALVGFSMKLPHISGKDVDVDLKGPLSPGDTILFPDWGMPLPRGRHGQAQYGHLIVEIDVQFPRDLNDEQRKVIGEALSTSEWRGSEQFVS